MREIKFRGIQKGLKRFVYGSYFEHRTRTLAPMGFDEHSLDEIQHVIIQDGFSDWNMPRDMIAIEVDPATVGQFTGLLDKNSKEIYEGDIVDCDEELGKVHFDDGSFWIAFDGWTNTMNEFYSRELEVIGNIHEN